MKRLLTAAAALLCAALLPTSVFAQTTQVTATQLKMGGVLIPSGKVNVLTTDKGGTALSLFTSDGTLNGPVPFSGTVTSGAIAGGFTVPDQCTSAASIANTPIYYRVEVSNTAVVPNQVIVVIIPPGNVCGSTFALDHYTPAQTAAPTAAGLISAPTVPTSCTAPGMFYLSVSPYTQYQCAAGHFVVSPSSGGSSISLTTNGSSGVATLTAGVLNIPNYAGGSGSTGTTLTTLTCNGTLAIPMPAAGTKVFYQVNTTANCTVSFTGLPSTGTAAETRVLFNPTAFAVTFPASSSTMKWNGGSVPDAPTSSNISAFHVTAYPTFVVGRD